MSRTVPLLDRPPFNSPWVTATVARYALPIWFGVESLLGVLVVLGDRRYLFFDARLYLDATRAWMAGGDPWQVQLGGNYFAAPPPSLLFMVPAAVLPPDLGVAVVALVVAAGSIATVRLLRLPWWWLLFPPSVQCMLSANIHALLVPLVLVSAGSLAAIAKVYAVVPLVILGRWRALAIAAIVLLVTTPVLPWQTFIAEWPTITGRLQAQTKLGVPMPLLLLGVPVVLVAVASIGRERGAWLAVSALWPAQQFYYGTLVLPIRSKIAAAVVALPVPGAGLLAACAIALSGALARRSGDRPRREA